jgi:hypothetical protein
MGKVYWVDCRWSLDNDFVRFCIKKTVVSSWYENYILNQNQILSGLPVNCFWKSNKVWFTHPIVSCNRFFYRKLKEVIHYYMF